MIHFAAYTAAETPNAIQRAGELLKFKIFGHLFVIHFNILVLCLTLNSRSDLKPSIRTHESIGLR